MRTQTIPLALLLVAAAVLAGCAAPAASTDAPQKIVLAVQPTDNAGAIQDRAVEMEAFLEAQLKAQGVDADVEIIVPLTYVGVVEALRFGHADAALMGSWPAVIATQKADARIVLAEAREVMHGDESVVAPYYYSYYVVNKDSPYQTLADVEGKTVAYASPTSGSGYIFPLAKLVQDGHIDAAADGKLADASQHFGEVFFAGGYAQAWQALQSGQADVAVTAGDINAALFTEVLDNTRIIATQGPVPSHTVVFADDFEGETADAFEQALLGLKGDKKDLMRQLVSGIFVEFTPSTTEEHVAALEDALRLTGIRFGETLG